MLSLSLAIKHSLIKHSWCHTLYKNSRKAILIGGCGLAAALSMANDNISNAVNTNNDTLIHAKLQTLPPSAPSNLAERDEVVRFLQETLNKESSFDDRYEAEVWLKSKMPRLKRFVKDPVERLHILRAVHRAAKTVDLQPEIVLAVIEVESHFDRYAISRVGAQGMMQIMPFWKNEIGHPEDNLMVLETNLTYGCTILKHYIKRSKGHLANALARYNGSYGRYTYSEKVMTAWDKWR